MTQVCNLRASIPTLLASEIVARCKILEFRISAWPMCCPPAPPHIAIKTYSSYSMAWNMYRCLRITINGLILEHSPEQSLSSKLEGGALITQLCSDIYNSAKAQIEKRATELRVCDSLPLVWPLTVAAVAQQKTNDSSVIELLEYMGRASGINQCLSVTHTILSTRGNAKTGSEGRGRAFDTLQARILPSA